MSCLTACGAQQQRFHISCAWMKERYCQHWAPPQHSLCTELLYIYQAERSPWCLIDFICFFAFACYQCDTDFATQSCQFILWLFRNMWHIEIGLSRDIHLYFIEDLSGRTLDLSVFKCTSPCKCDLTCRMCCFTTSYVNLWTNMTSFFSCALKTCHRVTLNNHKAC